MYTEITEAADNGYISPLLKPGTEHGMERKKKKEQNGIRNGTEHEMKLGTDVLPEQTEMKTC